MAKKFSSLSTWVRMVPNVGHAGGRICDESILLVSLGESHHWFQGELFLQHIKILKGQFQKRARFVSTGGVNFFLTSVKVGKNFNFYRS